MGKYILIALALVFVNGCGSKDSELTIKPTTDSEINKTIIHVNSVQHVDFVPEHVRKSTIEVVPH